MSRLSPAARLKLAEAPWLAPFVNDGDTDLIGACARHAQAERAAKAEIRSAGMLLHERVRTSSGLETTALKTHPEQATS